MHFTIRHATEADGESIADAHRDSISTIGPRFYPPPVVHAWCGRIRPSMYVRAMANGEIFFVAIEQSVVLGFSSHRMLKGQHRTAVYVRGGHSRQGIGTALFQAAEDSARRAGAVTIDDDASLAAVEFYERQGFQEVGRGDHRFASGEKMRCVFMRKRLE